MKPYRRYAIYFAPRPETALAALGARWFAGDVKVAGLSDTELGAIVDPPAHYGFHGTLKAPFRLTEASSADDLFRAIDVLAGRQAPVRLPVLALKRLGGFFALVPGGPCPELDLLARNCVAALDGFRAPLSEEERARRQKAGLNARQEELLERWGYPYVLDQFRFHLTLTSQLYDGTAQKIEPVLHRLAADALEQPTTVEDVCVFGDPGGGEPFELIRRVPLGARG